MIPQFLFKPWKFTQHYIKPITTIQRLYKMLLSTPLSYSTYNILPLTPPPPLQNTLTFFLSLFIFNPDFNIHVHIICHNHIPVVLQNILLNTQRKETLLQQGYFFIPIQGRTKPYKTHFLSHISTISQSNINISYYDM